MTERTPQERRANGGIVQSATGGDTIPVVLSPAEEAFKITKVADGSDWAVTPVAVRSEAWCEPDGCPGAICGGPHVRHVSGDGSELLVPAGMDPLPGFKLAGERDA